MLRSAAAYLEQLRDDGVFLEDDGGAEDDYARLVTTDPKVAEKYGLVDESEYWGPDEEVEDAGSEREVDAGEGSGRVDRKPGADRNNPASGQ